MRASLLLRCLAATVLAMSVTLSPSSAQTVDGPGNWVDQELAAMTLEQKVGQLFAAPANSFYKSVDDPHYRHLLDLIENVEVGGIIFFQGEPTEQAVFANELQRRSRLPLLVSQDAEWGMGMRLDRTTTFPRTMALGASGDPDLAYLTGYLTAREARALGVHQVFAPVADINTNPQNPIINVRSFGDEPSSAAAMVSAYVHGVQDGGALATVKHFPGHGNTDLDSHSDLPVIPFDTTRAELIPFRSAIEAGVASVMTGHLRIPDLDPEENVTATLSLPITTTLLRNELGFQGLVVTDALNMDAVTRNFSTGEMAVRALSAGADMLLMPVDIYAARSAILDAVADGTVGEDRLDEAVRRILAAKHRLGLQNDRLVDVENLRRVVLTDEHQAAADHVARRGLTLLRNEGELLPVDASGKRILQVTLSDSENPTEGRYFAGRVRSYLREGASVDVRLIDMRSPESEFERVVTEVANYDLLIVPAFTYVRSSSGRINLSARQLEFVNRLVRSGLPVILVALGNPYSVMGLDLPDAYLATYGTTEASQAAAVDALFGATTVSGRLPITIPETYDFGAGLDLQQIVPRRGFPEEVGLDGRRLAAVDSLMRAAIARRAFPGASVAIGREGVVAKLQGYGYYTYENERPVTEHSLYDLASLTKVIATTTAVMKLYEEGRIDLNAPLARYLPEFSRNGKQRVTVRQILTHQAGLIPYRPFHRMGIETREQLIEAVMNEELQYRPGTDTRYSDLGIISLALAIERITGQDFATYTREQIFEPLGMASTGFRPTGFTDDAVAPTEYDDGFRQRLLQGEVHDEAAWLLGGTAGHAGLFSTAADLARFAYMMVNDGQIFGRQFLKPETIRLFTTRVDRRGSTRALGWDTRSDQGYSSAGTKFGPRSFGHTGFTGTSIWIDPDQNLYVILLANRVHPSRENNRHVQVRSDLADIAYGAIAGPASLLMLERLRMRMQEREAAGN
jgi:beta-N-acetylhexosaminidase